MCLSTGIAFTSNVLRVAVSKVREAPGNPDSDIRHIRTVRYKFDGEGFLDDKYRQLFLIDAETGAAQQITDGSYDHRDPCWSPSGYEIAFAADRVEGWEFRPNRDIYALRVQGGAIRRRRHHPDDREGRRSAGALRSRRAADGGCSASRANRASGGVS